MKKKSFAWQQFIIRPFPTFKRTVRNFIDLTDKELDNEPKCPHCDFKPALEKPDKSAALALEHLDEELDKMLDDWKLTLMLNLQQPETKSNIELLKPDAAYRINLVYLD